MEYLWHHGHISICGCNCLLQSLHKYPQILPHQTHCFGKIKSNIFITKLWNINKKNINRFFHFSIQKKARSLLPAFPKPLTYVHQSLLSAEGSMVTSRFTTFEPYFSINSRASASEYTRFTAIPGIQFPEISASPHRRPHSSNSEAVICGKVRHMGFTRPLELMKFQPWILFKDSFFVKMILSLSIL